MIRRRAVSSLLATTSRGDIIATVVRPCCTASSFSSSAAATTKSINTSSRLIHHLRGGGIGSIKRICHHDNINSSSSSSRHQHNSISSFSSSPSSLSSSSKSLKKVIRPFLVACHPDLMHATTTNNTEEGTSSSNNKRQQQHRLSIKAREVNLKAVQIINGLIDNLEDLIGRCVPPCYSDGGGHNNKSMGSLPELKARYEIEFILPSSEDNSSNSNGPMKKKRYKERREALTLRSITMEFPESLRSSVRQWALTSFPDTSSSSLSKYTNPDYEPHPQEQESYRVAMQLRQHATAEFVRLLTISGMEVPRSSALDGIMHDGDKSSRVSSKAKEESQWTLSDHFLHEMGINPMEDVVDPSTSSQQQGTTSAFFGRMQQPRQHSPSYSTKMHQQRQAFMSKIPWEKFRTNYDQAFLDAQADCTTSNLKLFNPETVEGRERRERLVSQICSNVRILRLTGADDTDSSELDDDIPEGLDVVQQLIAIRRLNLILYDNFDYLQMERMGRMWENLGIVLLPPRENRRGGAQRRKKKDPRHANAIHPGRKLNKWERRMKRRQRLEPVSRGQMRYIADEHFSKISRKESDDVKDGEAEDEKLAQQYHVEPESGFKFSYGTRADQGTGHVTAFIPVDFGDDELVRQLYSHLYDYFDNCCGDMGFLSYGADGQVNANLTKDFEREDVSRTRGASTEGKVDTERVA